VSQQQAQLIAKLEKLVEQVGECLTQAKECVTLASSQFMPQPAHLNALEKLPWSQPNAREYQWIKRFALDTSELRDFLGTLSLDKWRKEGPFVYRLSGNNGDLVGRVPARNQE